DEREFDLHRDLLRRIAAEHLEYGLLVLAVDAVVLSSNERAASAGMEVDAWHTHPDLAKLRVGEVAEDLLRRTGETRGAADLRRRGIHGRRLLAPHRTANRPEIEVRSVDRTQVVLLRRGHELGAHALGPRCEGRCGREEIFVARHGVLQEPVDKIDVVAVKLHTAGDLVARERSAMNDELQSEVLDGRAGATGTGRRRADVAKAALEDAVRLPEPVDHTNIGSVSRAAEGVAFDLIDRQLPAEAARDRLHELGEDLLRVVLLGAGDKGRVPRDVRHDQETFHRPDGTSAACAQIALSASEAQAKACPAAAIDGALKGHRAPVGLGDILHDRQAEARSW